MENNIENKKNSLDKFKYFILRRKKLLIGFIILFVLVIMGIFYSNYYSAAKNKEISEKYISAGVLLASNDLEKSKTILKEIVLEKNKIYSLLALNIILENSLEENKSEILKLFEEVEKIKIDKEKKNLLKLKKGLYLIKVSDIKGKKLLKEIISDNSIWKEVAEDALIK